MRTVKHNSLLFGLTILIASIAVFGLAIGASAYDRESNNKNRVRVDVKPIQLYPGQSPRFEVRMFTHSVELNQDMIAVSTLKDDQGKEYHPNAWKGAPPGGHHRKGTLEFPMLEGNPNRVTLIMRNIANVPERIFEWDVAK